jgi:hypothetical protein
MLDLPTKEESIVERIIKQNKIFVTIIGVLLVVNIIGFRFVIIPSGNSSDFFRGVKGLLFGCVVIGCILGSLFAAIPYKGLPYGIKFLRASTLTILVLQVLFTAMILLNFLARLIRG